MTDADSTVTRRTVLRTSAVATGALVGTVGTASASHFGPGDCVVAVIDHDVLDGACPTGAAVDTTSWGLEGTVQATCSDGLDDWLEVEWASSRFEDGWVDVEVVDACDDVAVVEDAAVWEFGCPAANQVDSVFPFLSGSILDVCPFNGLVRVDWDRSGFTTGWVRPGALELERDV